MELHLLPEGLYLIIMGRSVITKSLQKKLKIPELLKATAFRLWSKISIDVELTVST